MEKNNRAGITINNVPLSEYLDKEKAREVQVDFREEVNRFSPAIRSQRGGRVKMMSAEERGATHTKVYSNIERIGILVQQGGGMKLKDFLRLTRDTQKKMMRLFNALKELPDEFMSMEVKPIFTDMGISDHQRYLMMLHQAGFLERVDDLGGRRIKHKKTDLCKMPEDKIAAHLLDANSRMIGFESPSRQKLLDLPGKAVGLIQKAAENAAAGRPPLQGLSLNVDEAVDAPVEISDEVVERQVEECPVGANKTFGPITESWQSELLSGWEKIQQIFPGITVKDYLVLFIKNNKICQ